MSKDEANKDEPGKHEPRKDASGKPAGVGRLVSDLRTAKLELLSAQTASVSSIRLQILFLSGNLAR